MKSSFWAIATVALCACGGSDAVESLDAVDRDSALTVAGVPSPTAPVRCVWPDDSCIPKAPPIIKLEAWPTRGFWPADTESAFTFYFQSPTDATRFRVYGMDPVKRRIVFVAEGSKLRHLRLFTTLNAVEISGFVAGGAPGAPTFSDGALLPVFRVPPPPPGPGGNDWLAYKAFNAGLDMQQVAENAYLSK